MNFNNNNINKLLFFLESFRIYCFIYQCEAKKIEQANLLNFCHVLSSDKSHSNKTSSFTGQSKSKESISSVNVKDSKDKAIVYNAKTKIMKQLLSNSRIQENSK